MSENPLDGSGVYFLIRDGAIVYVGSSIYPSCRVFEHERCERKQFDAAWFLPVEEEQREEVERHWIRTLAPVHNKAWNPQPNDDFPGWGSDPNYFLLRLPAASGTLLRVIAKRNSRSMTIEAQIALERRASVVGVNFKPQYPATRWLDPMPTPEFADGAGI